MRGPGDHCRARRSWPISERLKPYWDPGFWVFHSPARWRRHRTRGGAVEVEAAGWQPDGWRDWLRWSEVCAERTPGEFMAGTARDPVELLRADVDRLPGSARVVGRRL